MIVLDVNILLYAFDAGSAHHERVREWLEATIESGETVGVPCITAWGFLRIATNPRVRVPGLTAAEALEVIHELLDDPRVHLLNPSPLHFELLAATMADAQISGSDTTDAILAAMALEHGATLASTDVGFRRFTKLRWVNPLLD